MSATWTDEGVRGGNNQLISFIIPGTGSARIAFIAVGYYGQFWGGETFITVRIRWRNFHYKRERRKTYVAVSFTEERRSVC